MAIEEIEEATEVATEVVTEVVTEEVIDLGSEETEAASRKTNPQISRVKAALVLM